MLLAASYNLSLFCAVHGGGDWTFSSYFFSSTYLLFFFLSLSHSLSLARVFFSTFLHVYFAFSMFFCERRGGRVKERKRREKSHKDMKLLWLSVRASCSQLSVNHFNILRFLKTIFSWTCVASTATCWTVLNARARKKRKKIKKELADRTQ